MFFIMQFPLLILDVSSKMSRPCRSARHYAARRRSYSVELHLLSSCPSISVVHSRRCHGAGTSCVYVYGYGL